MSDGKQNYGNGGATGGTHGSRDSRSAGGMSNELRQELEETDLTGMDRRSAKEYVYQYVATYNNVAKQLEQARNDAALWQRRAELARDKGDEELTQAAVERWEAAQSRVEQLAQEEQELARKVERLKMSWDRLSRTPERTVDAEALAQQLDEIVGEEDKTRHRMKDVEADSALEELKRKMREEGL